MLMRRAGAIVFGIAMMGASVGMYAAPRPAMSGETQAASKHGKMISFTVKNGTAGTLSLKCGEEPMTLDAGKATKVKLQEGATITFAEANGGHEAGSILAQANSATKGSTVTVH